MLLSRAKLRDCVLSNSDGFIPLNNNALLLLLCTGVSIGGPPACYIVENHLSRFIEGQVSRFII